MMFERLQDGDTVGIIAPASPVSRDRIAPAVSWLEACGYKVKVGDSVGQQDRFLAGTDEARAQDLMQMFIDDSVRAVLIARGGYGSSRVLDWVDWSTISGNPKPFVGFSDTTAFQLAMYAQSGMPSLTGFALGLDAAQLSLINGQVQRLAALVPPASLSQDQVDALDMTVRTAFTVGFSDAVLVASASMALAGVVGVIGLKKF